MEQGLWLLSDWYDELRSVDIEGLKRRISRFRVDQLGLFSDACRDLPADIDQSDLGNDKLLGRGPEEPSSTMAIDKFIAAQDGAKTFMIPGSDPDGDRCLFSGVLLEALWGTKTPRSLNC